MLVTVVLSLGIGSGAVPAVARSVPFEFRGMYVEGCTCKSACAFELTGANPGCSAVLAFQVDSGTVEGKMMSGSRIAAACGSEGWLRLYVDAPDYPRYLAASRFATAALKDFGKLEGVFRQPVSIEGSDGNYVVKVAGGEVLELRTASVLMGRAKGPLTFSNIFNATLHPEIFQAKTSECKFQDGGHLLEFKDSNAFYHPRIRVKDSL